MILCFGGYADGDFYKDVGQVLMVSKFKEAKYAFEDYTCCNPDTVTCEQEKYIKQKIFFKDEGDISLYVKDGISPKQAIEGLIRGYKK